MSADKVSRRTVLQTIVMGAAGAAASACGGGSPPPAAPAAAPEPAPAPAAEPSPPVASEPAVATPGSLPPLSPSDPAAVALKYTSDASQVNPAAFPTYVKGQACASCIQFKGAPGDSQGPCAIFPGRAVAATGWCTVYARKA